MFPVHFAARFLHSSLLDQKNPEGGAARSGQMLTMLWLQPPGQPELSCEAVLVMPFSRGDKQLFLTLNRS